MMEECMEIRENNDNNHENNVENSNNNDNNIIIINNNINDNIIINNNNNSMEFPEGMRVLAVDDNSVCLKILTRLLDMCRYQVTSLRNKTEALELLKQNVDNFDIVLTNVNIDEMDGFKLLEAGLELDIPVIMISASENKSIIMKGVRHGAVDYLIKPVRFEAVKTIWQHVYRKTLISSPMTGGQVDETQVDLVGTSEREEDAGHVQVHVDEDTNSRRVGKRKCPTDDDSEGIDVPPTKRERIKWTTELHKKFLEAVEFLGGVDKAVPKKILEYMNVLGLSREKVASHLQKFRKSIQKSGEGSLKQENQNNNARGYLINSPSLGSTSVATTLMSRGHLSIIGNHNLSRGSLLGPNCINQPNNNNSLRIGSSIGGYTPPRTLLQPQCSRLNHQIIMQQPSTSMIMPAEGNILGSVSSTLLDLQTYPQLLLDNPFDLRIIQAPDEMFDPSPSMIDSTYEPPPLNNIFDIGEYPSLYEFAEDDKPKF